MIEINLLPQESAGRSAAVKTPSESAGALQVTGLLVAAYVVLAVAAVMIYKYQDGELKKEAALKAQSNKLKAEVTQKESEYKELSDALAVARNQLALLRALDPEDRLFWAEKLNILPKFIPDGVYLTELAVTEKVTEIETRESREAQAAHVRAKKQGPPPPVIKQPVISQQMTIKGVSYVPEGTSDERLQLIVDVINRVRFDKATVPFSGESVQFLEFFKPTVPFSGIRESKMSDREVTSFQLTLDAIPVDVAAAVDSATPKAAKAGARP